MNEGRHGERRRAPARCDGCGRAADEAGMTEHGWTIVPASAAVPGTYCMSCASALRMLDWFIRCVDCGDVVDGEAEAERCGWRFYADELGQLQPHCGFCSAERR